jgi:hypothetical protein
MMTMRGTILSAVLAAAALSGCYATGDVGYRSAYYGPTSSVYVSTPDLVTVSPGVQVVADYDEPVFYTDGFYWRYYNNGWYRSNYYASGWSYYDRPPVAVLRIERPYAYAHYRPAGYAPAPSRRYEPPAAIVRDHRAYGAEPVYRTSAPPAGQPAYSNNGAVVRDHRTYAPAGPAPAATYRAPAPVPAPAPAPAPRRAAPAPAAQTRDHRH